MSELPSTITNFPIIHNHKLHSYIILFQGIVNEDFQSSTGFQVIYIYLIINKYKIPLKATRIFIYANELIMIILNLSFSEYFIIFIDSYSSITAMLIIGYYCYFRAN